MAANGFRESLAVIGGGITGIAAALELAKSGKYRVTLFEKENRLGGLNSPYEWQDVSCDRFYHIILPSDKKTIRFIKDLGLESQLVWKPSKSGFFGEGKLVPFSSARDYLRFPFLSLREKFRLGLGIIYCTRFKSHRKLDKLLAPHWLKRIFGQNVYTKIWDSLLRSKLGDAKDRTSASFIWATIKRLYGSGSLLRNRGKMGYVRGGYFVVLRAAQKRLLELGVKIMTDTAVIYLERKKNGKQKIVLRTPNGEFEFARALLTIPCPEIVKVVQGQGRHPYWRPLRNIEYLGVTSVLMVLKRPLSPYYVINLLDQSLPFTGVIETTNVLSPDDFGGKRLVYLPKYLTQDDPFNKLSDDRIKESFILALKSIFPNFSQHDVLHQEVFRESYVQPLHGLNFPKHKIGFRTPLSGLYTANSSQNYKSPNNNHAEISLAREVVKVIREDSQRN
jgi:protoporphyrinogen oxidase